MNVVKCRSCEAPIFWTVNQGTRRAMPVDAEPVAEGNIELTGKTGRTRAGSVVPVSRVVPAQAAMFDPARYVSHFATCPDASDWREKTSALTGVDPSGGPK